MAARKNALKPDESIPLIKENHILIEVSYQHNLVFPMKEGMAYLAAMGAALTYEENYSKQPIIKGYSGDTKVRYLSDDDFRQYRLNHILGVNDEPSNNTD